MNLWVQLPEPLDAGELAPRAVREGVSYMPGKHFAVGRPESGALRLSFAGLKPAEIREGIAILGRIFTKEVERVGAGSRWDSTPALV
jgi:2-aminoadipate transaminase